MIISPEMADREAFEGWVNTAADVWLTDTPVRAQLVTTTDTAVHNLRETMGDDFPDAGDLPSPVLVGPEGKPFVLPSAGADGVSMDWVMDTFASIVESPARVILRENLIKALCVVLLVEGEDADANAAAKKAIEAASAKIKNTTTELGRVVTTPPLVIGISPDDAREQILLWSLKLAEDGASAKTPRSAMIVGRGELRGPVLAGAEITEKETFEQFEMLGRSCSCTTSATWLSGPATPLQWGSSMDDAVQDELGFNPRDPDALRAIAGVVSGINESGLGALGLGYRETQFDPIPESEDGITAEAMVTRDENSELKDKAAGGVKASLSETVAAIDPGSTVSLRPGGIGVAVLAGIALLAMGVGTMIVLQRSRSV
jgi:hypothetical protein